jgi:Amt family ammonium transporter
VHGVGGFAGCLLTGVFATRAVNSAIHAGGWIDGNPAQVLNQLIGAVIGIGLGVVGTLAALKITDLVTPVHMTEGEEATGMDLALHGEEGYNFEG